MINRQTVARVYPVKPLGEVVEFLDHRRRPVKESERKDGPFPYYGANGQQGTIDSYIFDEPLVLVAEDGGFFDAPERGIAYRVSGKTWVNNHAHVLRPRKGMDINFLCRVLENYDVAPFISGTTRSKLTKGQAEKIEVPTPPLADQKRIAAILDQADELRQKQIQRSDRIELLDQAIFVDMFGDPAKNPLALKNATLGDVIHSATDGPHVSPTYTEDGVPFLSTRHIRHSGVIWDDLKYISPNDARIHWKKCKPERGDILYTKGGTTGIAAAVDFDREIAVWVHVALLKPKHDVVRTEWLEVMLNSEHCHRQSQKFTHGIANRDLGLKRMVNISIIVPEMSRQNEFVDRLGVVRRIREANSSATIKFDALFASLQHRAFNGELTAKAAERELAEAV